MRHSTCTTCSRCSANESGTRNVVAKLKSLRLLNRRTSSPATSSAASSDAGPSCTQPTPFTRTSPPRGAWAGESVNVGPVIVKSGPVIVLSSDLQ